MLLVKRGKIQLVQLNINGAQLTQETILFLYTLDIFKEKDLNIYQTKRGFMIRCQVVTGKVKLNNLKKLIRAKTDCKFINAIYNEI